MWPITILVMDTLAGLFEVVVNLLILAFPLALVLLLSSALAVPVVQLLDHVRRPRRKGQCKRAK